jgi:hypothetical protein
VIPFSASETTHDLERGALDDGRRGEHRGRQTGPARAADEVGLDARARRPACQQVDLLEALRRVIAQRVGHVLAGELDVLDP